MGNRLNKTLSLPSVHSESRSPRSPLRRHNIPGISATPLSRRTLIQRRQSEIIMLQRRLTEKGRFTANIKGTLAQRKIMRRPSDFSDLQHLRHSSEGVKLNQYQRNLVREAFPKSQVLVLQASSWIFEFIMKREPTLKGLFETKFSEMSAKLDPPMTTEECIDEHTAKFAHVLEVSVSGIDSLEDSLGSYLTAIGASHAELLRRVFTPSFWDLLAQAMIESASSQWRIKREKLETLVAWRMVVFFIIEKVRSGYEMEFYKSSPRLIPEYNPNAQVCSARATAASTAYDSPFVIEKLSLSSVKTISGQPT